MSERLQNRIGRVCAPSTVDFLEAEARPPAADEVRIKIVSSAICGSDLHIYKGMHPSVPLPATIGHEFAGDIVDIGSSVSGFKPGDRVTVEPCVTCGVCEACLRGEYGYCEKILFIYRAGDGAMADYITVKASHVYHLPEYLSYDAGALIEPLSVAIHAVRRADIRMGESVLIIGAGAIGLLTAALCKKSGANEIAVVDFNDSRLEMARQMGATTTINPSKGDDVYERVRELTGGKGVHKSFECVGRQETFLQAMMSLRKNGLATIVGIFENPEVTIPATRFITHEIKVQGAQGYCWDFPVALSVSREIDLEKLITHVFKLDELQLALDTCLNPAANSIKVILKP